MLGEKFRNILNEHPFNQVGNLSTRVNARIEKHVIFFFSPNSQPLSVYDTKSVFQVPVQNKILNIFFCFKLLLTEL